MILDLVGLGNRWRAATRMWAYPAAIGESIMLVAGVVWLLLVLLYVAKWFLVPTRLPGGIEHPVLCCFIGLVPVSTVLVALALAPHWRSGALFLMVVGIVAQLAFSIYRTGPRWMGGREAATTTPVLYLPMVAGSFVSSIALSALDFPAWAVLFFGAGLFAWLSLESIVIQRLYLQPELPLPLRRSLRLPWPTLPSLPWLSVRSCCCSAVSSSRRLPRSQRPDDSKKVIYSEFHPAEKNSINLKISDQTALITGSPAGIGFAIARTLAAERVRVIVNGRTAARVDPAVAALRSAVLEAKVVGLVADLATVKGAAQAIAEFPDVDILVNNLGVYEPKPFEEITDADWLAIVETNSLSGVRLSRHHLPRMKVRNAGWIIFIASESAVNIPTEMMHYGVTKTMQVALARGLAESAVGTAVTVNSILAGPTRSEGVERFLEQLAKKDGIRLAQVEKEFFAKMRPTSLLPRFETIDEVAAMVAFIASPLSAGTNGAALRVEGGLLRSIL